MLATQFPSSVERSMPDGVFEGSAVGDAVDVEAGGADGAVDADAPGLAGEVVITVPPQAANTNVAQIAITLKRPPEYIGFPHRLKEPIFRAVGGGRWYG